MKSKVKKLFPLFLILLIGLSLRVYGVTYSLPTAERMNYYFPEGVEKASADELYVFGMLGTMHPDEVDMLGVISNMNPAKLDFNPHFFSYGGCLFFFILAFFLKIASLFKVFILTPMKEFYFQNVWEFAKMFLVGRVMVAMFGVASIFMVYRIAKSLYDDKKIAILSAMFIAILPWHVFLSHIMIPDIPATFWTTVTIFCSVKLFQTKRLKWYVLAGAACGLAAGTKLYGLISIFAIITAHLISKPQEKKYLFWLFDRKMVVCFLAIILFDFLFGNPYIVVSFRETVDHIFHRTPSLIETKFFPPNPLTFFSNIAKNVFGRCLIYLSVGLGPILFVLFILALIYSLYRKSKSDILLLWWIIPYYLTVCGLRWISPTYLLPIMPAAIILISRFIIGFLGTIKIGKHQGLLAKLLIIVIFFYGLFSSLKYDSLMIQKDTRMEAAEWIAKNISVGSAVGLMVDARDDQYCTAPPLCTSRYKIKVIQYEFEQTDLLKADYIILTGILQMQMLPEISKKFSEVKSFIRTPKIFGFSFNRGEVSDLFMNRLMKLHKRIHRNYDWLQPDIRIFKRSI